MWFLDAMAREASGEQIILSMQDLVVEYYNEFSDATDLEPRFIDFLETWRDWVETCYPTTVSLSELVMCAERLVNEGRTPDRFVRTESFWNE